MVLFGNPIRAASYSDRVMARNSPMLMWEPSRVRARQTSSNCKPVIKREWRGWLHKTSPLGSSSDAWSSPCNLSKAFEGESSFTHVLFLSLWRWISPRSQSGRGALQTAKPHDEASEAKTKLEFSAVKKVTANGAKLTIKISSDNNSSDNLKTARGSSEEWRAA